MQLSTKAIRLEEAKLEKTMEVIKSLLEYENTSIKKNMETISETKKYIWKNRAELDEIELSTEMYAVNESVSSINEQMKKKQRLLRSLNSPYFGRIDFLNEEEKEYYIGINGIMKDLNFYVFDWRTPVASLFYNFQKGPAFYLAPSGKIEGEITLKRQYKIENGKLIRCFDSEINIEDEYLQEILSSFSSEKMGNIVTSIQEEQNQVIRNLSDKYVIVQGVAGSGKTSVALHRIAYLLYNNKEMSSNNVLILAPNETFAEYISNVLPELGEENVLQTTFKKLSETYLTAYEKIETFSEFIERLYSKQDKENWNITKLKFSKEFAHFLKEKVKDMKANIIFTRSIKINGKAITRESLNKEFKRNSKLSIKENIERIAEYICSSNNIVYEKNGKIVEKKLYSLLNTQFNIENIYRNLFSEFINKNKEKEMFGDSTTKTATLKYEDLIPILYLTFELNEYPIDYQMKHVVVDEAQDYSLIQFEILKNIFRRASFTVLGDKNQTIFPFEIHSSLENIKEIFINKTKYFEFKRAYRSTKEIIEYTNEILNLEDILSVREKSNVPVGEKKVLQNNAYEALKADIKEMFKTGTKRLAIITKNKADAFQIYLDIKEEIDGIELIDEEKKKKESKISILPAYTAKGLEFDGVIAYSAKTNNYDENSKNLFYVVCTRAQHNLIVYNPPVFKLEKKHKK